MQLYHVSPEPITNIRDDGVFGGFLAFAEAPYSPSGNHAFTYRIDVPESEIVEAETLHHWEGDGRIDPFVREVMETAGTDENTAIDLLAQRKHLFDLLPMDPDEEAPVCPVMDPGEADWEIQRLTAEAAKAIGYRGASMRDEQGRVYFIDMLGRVQDLKLLTAEDDDLFAPEEASDDA